MATIKDEGVAVKVKAAPPTTPLTFSAGLPPETESRAFGQSKWPDVIRSFIETYEIGSAPGLEDGHWAWCNIQQYSARGRAGTALKSLNDAGHPWQFELKVKASLFEFVARNNDEGSAIYARLKGLMPTEGQPQDHEAEPEQGGEG